MKALAGRSDPFRVRMGGEQPRLLGIGAKAARDGEEQAGLTARCRRHAVERERDVRPHRLALPVGERAVVSAAARLRGKRPTGRRDELGGRPGANRDRHAPCAPGAARRPSATRTSPRTRTVTLVAPKALPPKLTSSARTRTPFRRPPLTAAAMAAARYSPSSRWRGFGTPGCEEGRLEQARIEVAHHLSGADRGEIGCALVLPTCTQRVAEGEQHQGTAQQRGDDRQHQQRRLCRLARARPPYWAQRAGRSGTSWPHGGPPSCDPGDDSTHARYKRCPAGPEVPEGG